MYRTKNFDGRLWFENQEGEWFIYPFDADAETPEEIQENIAKLIAGEDIDVDIELDFD